VWISGRGNANDLMQSAKLLRRLNDFYQREAAEGWEAQSFWEITPGPSMRSILQELLGLRLQVLRPEGEPLISHYSLCRVSQENSPSKI
jgi:hypothetical protein